MNKATNSVVPRSDEVNELKVISRSANGIYINGGREYALCDKCHKVRTFTTQSAFEIIAEHGICPDSVEIEDASDYTGLIDLCECN